MHFYVCQVLAQLEYVLRFMQNVHKNEQNFGHLYLKNLLQIWYVDSITWGVSL